jgi:MFS transporter, OFA family, oxalate/formate antiporter
MDRPSRGKVVAAAGFGVNLCLGVLYAWGVMSAALIDHLDWTATQTQLPYMVACAFFAFTMVPGGRLQDRLGPRAVIVAAAVLCGVGLFMSAITLSVAGLIIFFGVVFGVGIGLGYAAPTPAAAKWFGRHRRGLVSGVVVSGFGLAPLLMAPLTTRLISLFGIRPAFMILGGVFLVALLALSRVVANPPAGFVPRELSPEYARRLAEAPDWKWKQVLRTKQFFILWVSFLFGTFAGLLIIGQISKIGLEQAGIVTPFLLVGFYAVFNALGRVVSGSVSDRLGRERSLFLLFLIQVVTFLAFPYLRQPATLIAGIAVVGITFGGMLTIYPTIVADYYGLRTLGLNYGLVFTAWGVGGVLGPLVGGIVRDATGTYVISYLASALLSAVGAWFALRLLPVRRAEAGVTDGVPVSADLSPAAD